MNIVVSAIITMIRRCLVMLLVLIASIISIVAVVASAIHCISHSSQCFLLVY